MPVMINEMVILGAPCCFVGWFLTSKPWVPLMIGFRLRKNSKVLLLLDLEQEKKAIIVFLQTAQGSQS